MSQRPPEADPTLEAKLQLLRQAIANPPPFCSGVLALTDDSFTLMYDGKPDRDASAEKSRSALTRIQVVAALPYTYIHSLSQFHHRLAECVRGRPAPAGSSLRPRDVRDEQPGCLGSFLPHGGRGREDGREQLYDGHRPRTSRTHGRSPLRPIGWRERVATHLRRVV